MNSRYKAFFPLHSRLQSLGYKMDKEEILLTHTDGRTDSLRALTDEEFNGLIVHLRAVLEKQHSDQAVQRQRKKVIALMCQMGYVTEEDKPDMDRINAWCETYGHLHKRLNYYFGNDLTKLVSQAEAVYKSFIDTSFK